MSDSSGDVPQDATEAEYRDAGYIISSGYRESVMDVLDGGPATPKHIEGASQDGDIAHYSRAISELREREMVELLSPADTKKGRIYGLTDHGESVWELAQTINNGGG